MQNCTENKLTGIEGIRILYDIEGINHSYTYFPIFIDAQTYGETRDEVYERLKRHNIYGRRYFYPLISQFPTYRGLSSANKSNLPIAEIIANQVLCLPIFPDLQYEKVEEICGIIKSI